MIRGAYRSQSGLLFFYTMVTYFRMSSLMATAAAQAASW